MRMLQHGARDWALLLAVAVTFVTIVAEESQPAVPQDGHIPDKSKSPFTEEMEKRGWRDMNSGWGKRIPREQDWDQELQRGLHDVPNVGMDKRGWRDLQNGGWGKRGWRDLGNSGWGKRAWQDLGNAGWGKRGWQDLGNTGWGKRAWQDLSSGGWGKRDSQDFDAAWGKKEAYPELEVLLNDIEDFNKPWNGPEQRAPWGKRAVGDWQDARDNFGKRDPAWNNLKGLWGKRSGSYSRYGVPKSYCQVLQRMTGMRCN